MSNPANKPVKLYISGPMSGIKDFNAPAFIATSAQLRALGFDVISPQEMDAQAGFDTKSEDGKMDPLLRRQFLARDFIEVASCDGIYMMKGWSKSGGAKLERAFALDTGMTVMYADDAEKEMVASTEVRVTDPKTGGMKGSKIERLDLVPVEPMMELARVYGMGAKKYADNNWRQGYKWSLAYAAMMRHILLFWGGEDKDKESGLHHLGHAMFHCCSMIEFGRIHPEGDDRWKGKKDA